jgi:hypothetical protein
MHDGPADPLRHLHERVVQGDRPAIEELTAALLRDVSGALGRSLPGVDSDVVSDAVEDAILEYLKRPTRFDPSRGVPLVQFIRMLAYRNLQDAWRADRRLAATETRAASEYPLIYHPRLWSDDRMDVERLYRAGRAVCAEGEYTAFCLWAAGERSTDVLARALGLSDRPRSEQQRAVKQFKDRIRKAVERHLRRGGHHVVSGLQRDPHSPTLHFELFHG